MVGTQTGESVNTAALQGPENVAAGLTTVGNQRQGFTVMW